MTHIRWMIRRDMPEVLRLEGTTNGLTEAQLLTLLRCRKTIGMVAEGLDGAILGFMIYRLERSAIEVLRLAAWSEEVLVQLVDKLKSKLSPHRRNRLRMWVGDEHLEVHLFLKSQGFEAVAVEPYDGTDAYRFVWRLKHVVAARTNRSVDRGNPPF